LCDTETGETLQTLKTGQDNPAVAFGPDGRLVAALVEKQTVQVWDAETGQLVRTLHAPEEKKRLLLEKRRGVPGDLAFSHDALLLAAVDHQTGTLALWEVEQGRSLDVPMGTLDRVQAFAFPPDGKSLVGLAERTGIKLQAQPPPPDPIYLKRWGL